jgi:hypothetical protein
VRHATHIAEEFRRRGVSCATIFGKTPKDERDQIIAAFQRGEIRALASMGVLTTGFKAPAVDLIAMLRPTKSAGLYVQMAGRGTRLTLGVGDRNTLALAFFFSSLTQDRRTIVIDDPMTSLDEHRSLNTAGVMRALLRRGQPDHYPPFEALPVRPTWILVFQLFGLQATLGQNLAIGAVLTLVSLGRSYGLMRVFEVRRG